MSEPVQATVTNFHRLDGLNNKCLVLTVQEARKFKIEIQADLVSGEKLIPGCSFVSSHGRKRERALWGPFYKGTNFIHKDSTLMT